jgi:hypothetical protein
MTSTPPPADPDHIRIGNADRERVVQQLNTAFSEGRLEVHELDERVTAAYAAKTVADLRPLTADLPGGVPIPPAPRWPGEPPRPAVPNPPSPPFPAGARRYPAAAYHGWLTVFAINVVVWAFISLVTWHVIYPWPIWVALPLLIAVVARVAGGGWHHDRHDRYHQDRWERRQQRRDRRRAR